MTSSGVKLNFGDGILVEDKKSKDGNRPGQTDEGYRARRGEEAAQSRRTYYRTASELQKQARGFEVLRRRELLHQGFAALPNCDIVPSMRQIKSGCTVFFTFHNFLAKNGLCFKREPNFPEPPNSDRALDLRNLVFL